MKMTSSIRMDARDAVEAAAGMRAALEAEDVYGIREAAEEMELAVNGLLNAIPEEGEELAEELGVRGLEPEED